MKFRFPIVIIDEDFRSENTSGLGVRALAKALEDEGMEILGVTSYGDLSSFAQQQSRASAFILSIDDEEFGAGSEEETNKALKTLRAFVKELRFRNADIPIYLYGETRTSRHIPNDILRELHGFIHMFEDTPEFVARHIIREARSYLDGLAPPFFRAMVHYAQDGSYSWHCPGHSGGVAFLKSPVGQMFHQFFGENMLRADRSRPPSAMRPGSSTRITASSSPTAHRRRTRWSGMPTWRRTTSSSWTATATFPSCTRSP
jgi:arginine decarboxylase